MRAVHAPMQASVVQCLVGAGETVRAGQVLLVLEAMKMEHEVQAPSAARVTELLCGVGDAVQEAQVLLYLQPLEAQSLPTDPAAVPAKPGSGPSGERLPNEAAALRPGIHPDIRPDLQQVLQRHALTQDSARPQAVAKRHALGLRTARENIADLCDADSFMEYGALAVAAQRSRRSEEDLRANTPADGMVTGIGSVNGQRVVAMAYDATVLAGTQGMRNHQKTDRMLGLALQHKLPVVLFAEGGGGRPGDVDMPIVAGLHVSTFASFARLNGQVPVVGIAAGRCFAGNAALLGCCDVVIATRQSNIGMGGPAMVEGGGLGVYQPEDIGPSAVQHANGVIDLLVDDEAAAVRAARHYLDLLQTPRPQGAALQHGQGDTVARRFATPATTSETTAVASAVATHTAISLREVVPQNRLRAYDSRAALLGIADAGSLLELRSGFGRGIHTALARIEGYSVGMLANNPQHLGGAIDADAADKAARFMQLCNAHGLPLVSLIDTPGFMVGPDAEASAQVRHVSRMFIAAAHLRVPFLSVVLRKGYGLGAMAMAAGGFHTPLCTVAWPTAEFGAMGLEGAVRLGFKKELEAQPEGEAREALFQELLARQVAAGSGLNMAATLEIDAVIDPDDTRRWLVAGLQSGRVKPVEPSSGLAIDTW